jgi:hypothetical protein
MQEMAMHDILSFMAWYNIGVPQLSRKFGEARVKNVYAGPRVYDTKALILMSVKVVHSESM